MFPNSLLAPKIKYVSSVVRAVQFQRGTTCVCAVRNHLRYTHIRITENLNPLKQHKKLYAVRAVSSASNNTPDDFEERPFLDTEEHTESSNFDLKSSFYKDDDDELIKLLSQCQDMKQFQEVISRHQTEFQLKHQVQSIIVLITIHQHSPEIHPDIDELLQKTILPGFEPHIKSLNIDELSCCYLYLRKLNVPNIHPVMRDLLLYALKKINETELIPLSSLSRLSIAINTGNDFYIPMISANFIPHLTTHIESCYTSQTARLLAICLYNLNSIIDGETLSCFKDRVQSLLDTNILNCQTQKSIMKLIQLFNMPIWSIGNTLIIRNLMLALQENIHTFTEQEVKIFSRIFQHHYEPAALELQLKHAVEKQIKDSPAADILACYSKFVEPTKRYACIKLFKKILNSTKQWQQQNADINFFITLRALKISETSVCDTYWETILKHIENNEHDEKIDQRFLRHCHRYMHFNNNLGGTYRCLPLERKLTQMSMNALENDVAKFIPWKVSRLVSFIFAYGHTPYSWKKFPNTLLTKIISMADQFSPTDCFYLSRGLQICMEMRFRFNAPHTLTMQFKTIENILSGCIDRFLQTNEQLRTVPNLNSLVRTLSNRKSLKNSLVYQKIMAMYKTMDYSNLNSRTIRDLALIFTALNYVEPKALNAMFDYIEKDHEHILGDTVEKVLTCAYNLGYVPNSLQVLEKAADILIRDFDFMSGLSLVQACLALCFYKTIPESLINKVFCVEFIKRIEDEIQLCYSKATYPERVLNQVMQLNRTVCLDFPEANVPWFQQNYIEAQLSRKPLSNSNKFMDEVQQMLKSILKNDTHYRCNHTTPYGYQIDFVIHFDQQRKPIPAPIETTILDRITKVAILLLKLDSFCDNDLTVLRGPDTLKTKHLEMMGYKVLHINEHDWNSKYMSAPGAKTNYLKCLLQISC